MRIAITGRNIELTAALRDRAQEKIKRARKFIPDALNAHLILKVEKQSQIAELTVRSNGAEFCATERGDNMYAAIDGVIEKVAAQAKKLKGKDVARRKEGGA